MKNIVIIGVGRAGKTTYISTWIRSNRKKLG